MPEKCCKDCAYCNLKALSSGKWYCNSPEVSVFDLPVPIDKPCFKARKKGSAANA